MKYYFDENIPEQIARALNILDKNNEIYNTIDTIGRGVPDEDIIPFIQKQHGILVTQDRNIKRRETQSKILKSSGIGSIFYRPPKGGQKFWDMVIVFIKNWEDITKKTRNRKNRFAFEFSPRKKLEEIEF
jgi:hypothetical protein